MKLNLKRSVMLLPFTAAFLLSACVSKSDYDKLDAQNKQLEQQNTSMAAQITAKNAEIATKNAQIGRLQGAIKYTVNSDLMFKSGSWEMSSQGQGIIAKMALKLAPMQQSKIVVNGYTDNASIGPSLERQGVTSNQELSQKRAETVMQYLISQGVKPDLVSAKGFGEEQPVASNDTKEGRAQNRRVEITLGEPAT